MSQELIQAQSRQRVFLFAIPAPKVNPHNATVITPFGLRLADGLSVILPGETVLNPAFRTCLPAGCVVDVPLTKDTIAKFKAGEEFTMLTTTDAGQPLQYTLSLKGFTAAYERLVELTQ